MPALTCSCGGESVKSKRCFGSCAYNWLKQHVDLNIEWQLTYVSESSCFYVYNCFRTALKFKKSLTVLTSSFSQINQGISERLHISMYSC